MSKHTPGPWSISTVEFDLICVDDGEDAIKYPAVAIVSKLDDHFEDKNVASVDFDVDEAEANALLIAAAPDMLEALSMMTSLCRISYGNINDDVNKEIDNALIIIAKAKGESK